MMEARHSALCKGFSLIEMIIAISVLGILSASTAVFLRGPIASYFDTERRVDLANAGELAMAKMAQEISNAVPNSVRRTNTAGGFYLEFLPVISEGRYRIGSPGNKPGFTLPLPSDPLNDRFDVLCAPPIPCPTGTSGDWVVVSNQVPGADVWVGNSRTSLINIVNIAGGITVFHPSTIFLSDTNDHRFQIAGNPVTYFCDLATNQLKRYSGYALSAAQPLPPAAPFNILARQVTACSAQLVPGNFAPGDQRRAQLVALSLSFANAGDTLNLYQAIRVEPLP